MSSLRPHMAWLLHSFPFSIYKTSFCSVVYSRVNYSPQTKSTPTQVFSNMHFNTYMISFLTIEMPLIDHNTLKYITMSLKLHDYSVEQKR